MVCKDKKKQKLKPEQPEINKEEIKVKADIEEVKMNQSKLLKKKLLENKRLKNN